MIPKTPTDPDSVPGALQLSGCGSYLEDLNGNREAYLRAVAKSLDDFYEECLRRSVDVPDLLTLLEKGSDEAAEFFKWIAGHPLTPQMSVMIWRLLTGAEVARLDFHFVMEQSVLFRVELAPPHFQSNGGVSDVYESRNLWDFKLLHEFHMIASNGKPYLVGLF